MRLLGAPLTRGRRYLTAYLMVGPAMLVLALYVFIPLAYTAWVSFQDVHLGVLPFMGAAGANAGHVSPNTQTTSIYFGLRNWRSLLEHDQLFRVAVRNTLVMVGGACALGTFGALAAALVGSARLPFMGLFRTVYFFPAAISQVVTGLIFLWLFDQNFGLVNHFLGIVGLGPYPWQDDARYLLLSLTLAAAWLTASYNLPIFAAALRNVPTARREAAALDGAGDLALFRYITLPALRPVTLFVIISSAASISQMLGLYDSLAQDSLGSVTLVKYMFERAFSYNDLDYAGAIGCLMIAGLSLLAVPRLLLAEWREDR
ncbi:MAG: carbohydrate ABC transporter permease [Chloroflexota bacterium]